MATRKDPFSAYNFLVEIDGVTSAGFNEITVLSSEIDVIEYREGADTGAYLRKLRGLSKNAEVTLKRGYTTNKDLWKWFNRIRDGVMDRRVVGISLLNELREVVLQWTLQEAWPKKLDSGPFNAKTNEVFIETVVLVHEGVTIEE